MCATAPHMGKGQKPIVVVPSEDPEQFPGDDLTAEEIEQAEVGDLFSIQGSEFENVSWSIARCRTRQEIAADPQGQQEEWVADHTGQIHGSEIMERIGGGTFRFRGYIPRSDGRGVRMKYNRLIALAGPRKNFAEVASSPVPATAPNVVSNNGLTRGERVLLKAMREMSQRVDRLEHVAPQEKPSSITELVTALGSLDAMRQRSQPASDTSVAKEMFEAMGKALSQGIELGRDREPLPPDEGGNAWVKVAETFVPLAHRVLDRMGQRRSAITPPPRSAASPEPTPQPPPPSAPASHAEAIEDEEQSIATARMMVVVDLLSRHATEQVDVAECADAVAEVLTETELATILNLPDQAIVGDIASRAGGRYPILASEAGATYVGAVLGELRRPPEDES